MIAGRIHITHFTDPACPFAFSAEPVRMRLRWHYGDHLVWSDRLIAITREPGHAERLAEGAPSLQRRYRMPIDPSPYPRPASSEPACRYVVAARLFAPGRQEALLRAIRVRVMAGGLIDEPELLDAAARDSGLDPSVLVEWAVGDAVVAALEGDIAAADAPAPAARALDHKLAGPAGRRRYTAPSYELASGRNGRALVLPGFNPPEALEAAIANLDPAIPRRARPASVLELLRWADHPLATAEVAMVMAVDHDAARRALAGVAREVPAGADAYWVPYEVAGE